MKWTNDDIKLVEKFIEIKNKGYYVDGGQLTAVYNRVLEKNVGITNCGSCLRQRVNELELALNQFKKTIEVVPEVSETTKQEVVDSTKEEENKALTEAEKMKERMAKVRAAKNGKK